MSAHDEDRIQHLLRQALPSVAAEPESNHDLWPAVLRRLGAAPPAASPQSNWVWFDRALLAALAIMIAAFPASIPLLLYCL